jgi:hypothetical protein
MSFENRKDNSLEAWALEGFSRICKYELFPFRREIEESSRVWSTSMELLGLRDDELPEPAASRRLGDGHAEKTEFMAEGAEAGHHSCGLESHM